ncbi:substrate-binding periplasmic protein [Roseibium aquae]|nr:transporter substrate-binding domain-containing protein [Roseibium aquae]
MPTIFSNLLVSVLLAGVVAKGATGPVRADDRPLVFAADEWCPVNCTPGSEKPGFMVEIARAILEPKGYSVRYETINWARALLYTRQGHYDGVFGALREDAPDFVFPRQPMGQTRVGLFKRADSPWRYVDETSLDGRSVGLILDYAYGEDLETLLEKRTIPSYQGGDAPLDINLRKLAAGRIDLVIEDVNIFWNKAEDMELRDQFELAHVFSEEDIFLALSPAKPHSAHLAEVLSTGLDQLRASGEIDEIMTRYGLDDWK